MPRLPPAARLGPMRHVLSLLACLHSCACDAPSNSAADRAPDTKKITLTVFAASSLTESFVDLETSFERSHPDTDVVLVFAGSQTLRLQMEQGAQADVFASANELHMNALRDAGLVDEPQRFAENELVVIVPRDASTKVGSFAELPRAQRLVLGTTAVPVGIYARQVIERAGKVLGKDFAEGVLSSVVSEENNVRLVRAKVELGEADAALVYRSDAMASARVRLLEIPGHLNVRARYPIARVSSSKRPDAAEGFLRYVLSARGQALLSKHGFSVKTEQ